MNLEHLEKLLYTKIISKENGAKESVPMTQEEIDKYHQDLAEIKRKTTLPEYKFATVIAHPDKTFDIIIPTEEQIQEMKKGLEVSFWFDLRENRNKLLKESDVLVLPDRWESYTQEYKDKISKYRQDLRDLPQNTSYIEGRDPVYPEKP